MNHQPSSHKKGISLSCAPSCLVSLPLPAFMPTERELQVSSYHFAFALPSPCTILSETCKTREAAPGLEHVHSNPGHFAACKAEAFGSPPPPPASAPDRARRFHKLIEDECFLRNVRRIVYVGDFWFAPCRLRCYKRARLSGICRHLQPGELVWE